jgi:hypothetical protein
MSDFDQQAADSVVQFGVGRGDGGITAAHGALSGHS